MIFQALMACALLLIVKAPVARATDPAPSFPTRVVLVCGDEYCDGAQRGADAAAGMLPDVVLETVRADDRDAYVFAKAAATTIEVSDWMYVYIQCIDSVS